MTIRSYFEKRHKFVNMQLTWEKDTEVEVVDVLDLYETTGEMHGDVRVTCIFKGVDEKGNIDKFVVMSRPFCPLEGEAKIGVCIKGVWRVVQYKNSNR